MSTYAATSHTTWVAGYDMTGDSNKLTLNTAVEAKDRTVFGNVARNRVGGLRSVEASVDGFWDAATGAVDPTVFAALGGLQVVTHTVAGVQGDRAYFYQAKTLTYEMFDAVGEMVPFSLDVVGARGNGSLSVGAIPGRLLAPKGAVSATGAVGSHYQLGAVAAGQHIYGAVHVFTPGTTVTLVLESDDNSAFSSATTRATVGPLTAAGGSWATRVAGSITDTYWRWRVTAITGTFTLAAVAGIR